MTGVPVELDRTRELRYGVNALCILEEKIGKSLAEILGKGMGISMLRMVWWAGLVWDDKELTEEAAGNLMDEFMASGHAFGEVSDLITQALLQSGFVDPADVQAQEERQEGEVGGEAPLPQ